MNQESEDYLQLSKKQMKKLGYQTIDMIVKHFEELRNKPVTRKASRLDMEQTFREPIPDHGTNPEHILDIIEKEIFTNIMYTDHPRFFAFVPTANNFISVLADALVAGFNPFAGTWLESSSAAQIELVTVDWLRRIFGMPEEAGGLFLSGGSAANLIGIAVARRVKLKDRIANSVVYFSDQTHSSVERGLKVLGFSEENCCKLPSDDNFRLSIEMLSQKVKEDKISGKIPFCVVANAGTTNTGSVDPLNDLASFCKNEGLWLHVDGAFGAAGILDSKGEKLLQGIDHADSLVIDPHKWFFQPYEISCLLVRNSMLLKDTFRILPEYLKDTDRSKEEINFCDYGTQLTRSFRALKLWMSLKCFGLNAFRRAVTKGFKIAEYTEHLVRENPLLEVITPAQMGILTFRFISDLPDERLNELNRSIVDKIIIDGYAMVATTQLRDRVVLRMCTINPRTTEDDIRQTLQRITKFGQELF
ncbi:pyridoxal-dependent decarboxylase [Candidatus Borrarchaeum sp.]|uniref:pyridoxal phosphate-dependent decarboxylase family protein n=1 Tax=Candidatus Borrarchaeum sp. TaxID=2846742 RepID=UPI002579F61F|nr:pyridoxal-dependent decarboxylase [Candidatus Borrarchaeum sp.]